MSVFPVIGRVDPRSNWVPLYFLRYLLSAVGDWIVDALGTVVLEVWHLRALGRTFRYGAAFAYEGAVRRSALRGLGSSPQGALGDQEGPDQGELDIDGARRVDPGQDLGPYPQAVQVFYGPGSEDGLSSHWPATTSTTRSSGGLRVQKGGRTRWILRWTLLNAGAGGVR